MRRCFTAPGDPLLNAAFLTRCWNQHQRRHRDWSALLWTALMFKTWQRQEYQESKAA